MSNEVQTDQHGIPLEAERHIGGVSDPAYRPDFARQVVVLCRRGFTQAEIADFLGVHRHQMTAWRADHEEFSAAFEVGKEQADSRVERSLYERAVGYDAPAVKIFYDKDSGKVVREDYVEHYPPDPRSAEFQAAIERGRQRAGLTDGKTIEGEK